MGRSNFKKKKKKTCMELEFMELKFQNATIGFLKHHYRAPDLKFFFFKFLFSLCYKSIVQKSSFKLKLDFKKIKFINRDISLIRLGKGVKCWFYLFIYLLLLLREKAHFLLKRTYHLTRL